MGWGFFCVEVCAFFLFVPSEKFGKMVEEHFISGGNSWCFANAFALLLA
jgi:hypothetical protein